MSDAHDPNSTQQSDNADTDRTQATGNPPRRSARQPRDIVASVSARLLKLAHANDDEFQLVLMRTVWSGCYTG
jgi:hypothetical protein